jgi:trk system potassium uptake protein TrkA
METRAVIMGCGRVGSQLARLLYKQGLQVSVIDENPDAFRRLDPGIDVLTVTGTAIDEDVQRAAGIENATVFAAVTNRDNSNLMAAQIAREMFNVAVVMVRIYDPVRGEIYKTLGLDTISPTTIISNIFYNEIMKKLAAQAAQPAAPPPPATATPAPPPAAPTTAASAPAGPVQPPSANQGGNR